MSRENKTQFALLGILMFQSFSGYEIKKAINYGIGFFWSEDYGSIYPELGKLEKKGFVKKEYVRQEKKPSKNVYSITDEGKKHFSEWLSRPADYEKIRHEMLLKIFFGHYSTSGENIEKLNTEKEFHENLLDKYHEINNHLSEESHPSKNEKKYWLMTLDYGIKYSSMTIKWCEEMINIFNESEKQ